MRLPDSKYVDRYYKMDPETEGVLPGPFYLQEGMRILACGGRVDTNQENTWSKSERELADLMNLWHTVTQIYVRTDGNTMYTAQYDDGQRVRITASEASSWLVKLDSVEEVMFRAREAARQEFYLHLGLPIPETKDVPLDENEQPALFPKDTSNALGDGPEFRDLSVDLHVVPGTSIGLVDQAKKQFTWPTDADEIPSFDLSPVPDEESKLEEKGL